MRRKKRRITRRARMEALETALARCRRWLGQERRREVTADDLANYRVPALFFTLLRPLPEEKKGNNDVKEAKDERSETTTTAERKITI